MVDVDDDEVVEVDLGTVLTAAGPGVLFQGKTGAFSLIGLFFRGL